MPKAIVQKEDWIKLGYELFSDKGVSGIVIEKMAAKFKINKSGFYWHFSTKKAFIQQIIDYWIAESTSDIIDEVNKATAPKEKFEKLIELSFKKDNHIDFFFFIKKYAKSDEQLNALIDQLDQQRISFTKDLLAELGFSEAAALTKSKLFYKYLIGHHEMIRYKEQDENYLETVKAEIQHFIQY